MMCFATPAGQSCVTVDAYRRLCTGCTDCGTIGRNTLGFQELCVCMAGAGPPAKMRKCVVIRCRPTVSNYKFL